MKTKIFNQVVLLSVFLMLFSVISKANFIADDKTVEISLPTIQCGTCVKNIQKALKKVDGISSSKVDLENKKAIITYDDSKTTLDDLVNAITKAGYAANDKEADKEAYDKLMECCKLPEDRK